MNHSKLTYQFEQLLIPLNLIIGEDYENTNNKSTCHSTITIR